MRVFGHCDCRYCHAQHNCSAINIVHDGSSLLVFPSSLAQRDLSAFFENRAARFFSKRATHSAGCGAGWQLLIYNRVIEEPTALQRQNRSFDFGYCGTGISIIKDAAGVPRPPAFQVLAREQTASAGRSLLCGFVPFLCRGISDGHLLSVVRKA
jgi:hypothetical protein